MKKKDWVRQIKFCEDGSMKVCAKGTSAFETLKYVFDSSMHPEENVLVNKEREDAFIDWCHCDIEDWTVTETNEREKEITLKKIRNHKVN